MDDNKVTANFMTNLVTGMIHRRDKDYSQVISRCGVYVPELGGHLYGAWAESEFKPAWTSPRRKKLRECKKCFRPV